MTNQARGGRCLWLCILPLAGLVGGCLYPHGDLAAPLPPDSLPGAWAGAIAPSLGTPCRMVLYADGTGLLGWYTQVYRITRWTTAKSPGSVYYRLQGTLQSVDEARPGGRISGTVGPTTIDLRADIGPDGRFQCRLRPEREIEQQRQALKHLMAPYER